MEEKEGKGEGVVERAQKGRVGGRWRAYRGRVDEEAASRERRGNGVKASNVGGDHV